MKWESRGENQMFLMEAQSLSMAQAALLIVPSSGLPVLCTGAMFFGFLFFFLECPCSTSSGFPIKIVADHEQLKVNQRMLQNQGVVQMDSVCMKVSSLRRHSQAGGSVGFSCID